MERSFVPIQLTPKVDVRKLVRKLTQVGAQDLAVWLTTWHQDPSPLTELHDQFFTLTAILHVSWAMGRRCAGSAYSTR
jgi:hypothetical protein